MRVLYWTQQFWPSIGGVEVLAAHFIADMRKRGFEFTVITSHGNHPLPDEDMHDGVAIRRFPFMHAIQQRDVETLVRVTHAVADLKRRLQPDLVHIQLSDPSALFHRRSWDAHRAPTVVSVTVAPPSRLPAQSLLAELLTSAAWITTDSRAIAEDVTALVPSVAARISVAYPLVRLPRLAPAPLPFAPGRLLCAGRLVPDKGYDVALDALPTILAQFPDVRLIIAGDGAARAALERHAAALGVGAAVEFTGWIAPEEVPAALNRATVVLVPSRWREAFGVIALQAAQMGRPVVCSDVGGLSETVAHENTGLLVACEDPAALAAAVVRLLRDPAGTQAMGTEARRRATDMFNWDRHLDAYETLYRRLVRDSGDGRASA